MATQYDSRKASRRAVLLGGVSVLAVPVVPALAATDPDADLHAAIARWFDHRRNVVEPLNSECLAILDEAPAPAGCEFLGINDPWPPSHRAALERHFKANRRIIEIERGPLGAADEEDWRLYKAALAMPARTNAGMLAKLRMAAANDGDDTPDEIDANLGEVAGVTGYAVASVWRDLERIVGGAA